MPAPPPTRRRRRRLLFRGCRLAALLLVLGVLALVSYLNRVGLPAPAQDALLAELRDRGYDLKLSRVRWRWYEGLVAEDVSLTFHGQTNAPRIDLAELALNLHWQRSLAERRLCFSVLDIHGGRIRLPLTGPPAAETLALNDLNARVRLEDDTRWDLEEVTAAFSGATLHLSGTLTNGLALRRWTGAPRRGTPPWRNSLLDFVRFYRQFDFRAAPRLEIRLAGDALVPASFHLEARCAATGATTPWGTLERFDLLARMNDRGPTNGLARMSLRLAASQVHTPWGDLDQARVDADALHPVTNAWPDQIGWRLDAEAFRTRFGRFRSAHLEGNMGPLAGNPGRWHTHLTLSAGGLESPWGQSSSNRVVATLVHSLTNLRPDEVEARIELGEVTGRLGRLRDLALDLRAAPTTGQPDASPSAATPVGARVGDPQHVARGAAWQSVGGADRPNGLRLTEPRSGPSEEARLGTGDQPGENQNETGLLSGAWTNLAGFDLDATVRASGIRGPSVELETLSGQAGWRNPELTVTGLEATLYGGQLEIAAARLDTQSGETSANFALDFDYHQAVPLLGPGATRWLGQFKWATPPTVSGHARVVLPDSSRGPPDWAAAVLPTLAGSATIVGREATYRGADFTSARLSAEITNQVLRLRDFTVQRPEGRSQLEYELDLVTRNFRWQIDAQANPAQVGPVIDDNAPRILRHFAFTGPATARGAVWGCWAPPKRVDLALGLAATNFVFRGEPVDRVEGRLGLTNHVLVGTQVRLTTGTESIDAGWAGYDLEAARVTLTNVQGRMDPLRVARAIGSNAVDTLSPYRFESPPTARVEGVIQVGPDPRGTDLHVALEGDAFRFWRFNLPRVQGDVRWQGTSVLVTNLDAGFYSGQLQGGLAVDFARTNDVALAFTTIVTNVNLRDLIADTLPGVTNQVEGRVSGLLRLDHANPADWQSWNGAGHAAMVDGLLWDLPLFSIFSRVLNTVSPGLGNSRAKSAAGTFVIRNSIIQTTDLKVEAGPARMQFKGTVDFDGRLDARVEAEILRSMPVVGPLISFAFLPVSKAFIFKVGGTLGNPALEPLYVPKFILPLLNPLGTLKDLFKSPPAAPDPATPPPAP